MVGQKLLHYTILDQLGSGGMGTVYLARDTKLTRNVAVKLLPAEVRSNASRVERFKIEARAAAQLNHPNIAQIFGVEETDEAMFIVMEHVDGKPLGDVILADGMDGATFFDIFTPLADALCHAHERGVTHRDLKPGNIMITEDGVPKILDFGLAQLTRPEPGTLGPDDPTLSDSGVLPPELPGVIMGTPAYMSPEQAEGKPVDHRSDIFSFGVVLYEALTGRRPFEAESRQALLGRIVGAEPEPVTAIKPDTPYLLHRLITNSLEKDARRRVQSMVEVRRELEEVRHGVTAGRVVQETAVGASVGVYIPWWKKTPALVTTAALLVVVSALTMWITRPAPEAPLRKFQTPVARNNNWDGPVISPDGTMVVYTNLSPDGRRVAVSLADEKTLKTDVWIYDTVRKTGNRLTHEGYTLAPIWAPGGGRIAYHRNTPGMEMLISSMPDDRSAERILATSISQITPFHWSPDGRYVIYSTIGSGSWDLGYFDVIGGSKPTVFLRTPSVIYRNPRFSPDGRYVAYQSNETGRFEIYTTFPEATSRIQVSTNGGGRPRWNRRGDKLYYIESNRKMMVVKVDRRPSPRPGTPGVLFDMNFAYSGRGYDVTPDGSSFIIVQDVGEPDNTVMMTVVQNWVREFEED